MIVVGLTGSIGMGKSVTAGLFAEAGAPVYDSDAAVHAIYANGAAAVAPIAASFPEAVRDGAVDREKLSSLVLNDQGAFKRLEAIVHPLVHSQQAQFLEKHRAAGARLVVLDIPLLFETGAEKRFDAIVVVSAPADMQRARVLARPGMSPEKLERILAKQTPDSEKRRRADFVINTGLGVDEARAQVRAVLDALSEPA